MTQSDGFERIPELPEPIHRMPSFLTTKEAVKIVSLSKAWLSAWQTRPSLQFIDHYLLSSEWDYNNDFPTSEELLKLADYMTFTHSIFRRYCEYQIGISILVLNLNNLLASASLVDSWLQIAFENSVTRLGICIYSYALPQVVFESRWLVDLFVQNCVLNQNTVEKIRCNSLRQLCLFQVYLDDLTCQKIISSCRLIENLQISYCFGVENIKVTKLKKLKTFTVALLASRKVKVESPSLEFFYYRHVISFDSDNKITWQLQLNPSQNLKNLFLCSVAISHEFFLNFEQNLPYLEELKVDFYWGLQTLKSSSHSIRKMHLIGNLEEVQLDVPSMVLLKYDGYTIPEYCFMIPPCNLWVSDINIFYQTNLGTSWFFRLLEFLTKLIKSEVPLNIRIGPMIMPAFSVDHENHEFSVIFPQPQVKELFICFDRIDDKISDAELFYIFLICPPKPIIRHWNFWSPEENNLVSL